MRTHATIAGLGASAALAVIALNYQAPEGTQLFGSEQMTAADYEFIKFVSEYGRSYGTHAEYKFRSEQFKKSLAEIEKCNAEQTSQTCGVSFLTDWTHDEKQKLNGYKPGIKTEYNYTDLNTNDLPDSVNWVTKGAVTPIKDQKVCGSCWAFSTSGAIEGAMFIKTGKLQSLSEQQLLECDKHDHGCQGGWPDTAFKYIMTSHQPLMLEADYPYRGGTNFWNKCKFDASKAVGQVAGYVDVQGDQTGDYMKAALVNGPVSVAIEADSPVFVHYKSGVITSDECGGVPLNHAVLAVGYGIDESGTDYFLVKNSWGTSWGDQGYVKIGAKGNICGILEKGVYPTE